MFNLNLHKIVLSFRIILIASSHHSVWMGTTSTQYLMLRAFFYFLISNRTVSPVPGLAVCRGDDLALPATPFHAALHPGGATLLGLRRYQRFRGTRRQDKPHPLLSPPPALLLLRVFVFLCCSEAPGQLGENWHGHGDGCDQKAQENSTGAFPLDDYDSGHGTMCSLLHVSYSD